MLKPRLFFVWATLGLMLCSCKHPCQIDALGEACRITRCEEEGERSRSCKKKERNKWAELERVEHERIKREEAERERVERAERELELKRCEKEMGIRGEACFKARDRWERQRNDWELEQESCEEETGVRGEECFKAQAEQRLKERAEQEQLERERAKRERAEQERLERERAEQAERERVERAERERAERAERAERERAERERDKHLIKKCDCWYRCQSDDDGNNSYLVITSMCAARCGTHSTRVAQKVCGEYARRGWVKRY